MEIIGIYYDIGGYTNKYHHFKTASWQTKWIFHAFLPLSYGLDPDVITFHATEGDCTIPYTNIPHLHKLSEEELFQESTVWDYPISFEKWLGFQREVYKAVQEKTLCSMSTYEVQK